MKYIEIKRMQSLEGSIAFLSNYDESELYDDLVVGKSLDDVDKEATALLHSLSQVNVQRKELIAKLMGLD